jgi:hypothetical protein
MSLETLEPPKKEGREKMGRVKRAVTAAMLAGGLAHPSEAAASQKVEQGASEGSKATYVKPGESGTLEKARTQAVLYSKYQKGEESPVVDPDRERDSRRAELEAMHHVENPLTMPQEQAITRQEESIRNMLLINKAFEEGRKDLNLALEKIATATGSDASWAVQMAGGALIQVSLQMLDNRVSEMTRSAIVRGMPEGDAKATLDFFASGKNAENLLFTKVLGEKGKWRLTLGADPGDGVGGKVFVGATFRMILP